MLRGKFIAPNAYFIKEQRSHDLTLHLKEQEKEDQAKPKSNRRKEIIKLQWR